MSFKYTETSLRARNYNETLNLLTSFKNKVGITRLADLTYLDYSGLPVYTAIRPRAKSLTTSQGKGLTKQAAQCSALMESIEVYFAEEVNPSVVDKSEIALARDNAIFIPINILARSVHYTSSSQPMNWINAELVFAGKNILAPFAEFSLNSYLSEVLIYSPDSTGLAGGNTYEEALLHGLLEVIERCEPDNVYEIVEVDNELFKNVSNKFNCCITYQENRYGIPSFEVLIQAKSAFENQILFKGNGCHINKQIALNRALVEAIQSRVTTIAGSRDDLVHSKYDFENNELPVIANKKKFVDVPTHSVEIIDEALSVVFESIKKNNQDILVYRYYDEELCILKAKLIPKDINTDV